MKYSSHITYADDDTGSVGLLLRLRVPSLLIGMALGILISLATSRFEEVLTEHVQVAFFLPFIVYIAAAIGNQTQTIYARDLRSGRARFHNYLIKESLLGCVLGVSFGCFAALFVHVWLGNSDIALSVGLSLFGAATVAPVVSLLTTDVLSRLHEDPAAYAGPIATVLQDTISIVIYGFVASAILLS